MAKNQTGTKVSQCMFKEKIYKLKFFIARIDSQSILSAEACSEIGLITCVRAVDKPLSNEEVINDFGDVFKGLGKLPKTRHIELDPQILPVVHPPRKVSAALREHVRNELDRMESLGLIDKTG